MAQNEPTKNMEGADPCSTEACPICMEPITKAGMDLECGHRYHSKCGIEWLRKNNSCPLCRAKVCDEKEKSIQQIIHDATTNDAHPEDGFVINYRRAIYQDRERSVQRYPPACSVCRGVGTIVLDDGGYACCNSHCFTCDRCNKLYMIYNRESWRSNTCYTCAGGE